MWASVPYHSHYYYKDFHLFNIKIFFIFGCIFYLVSFIRPRIKQKRKKGYAYCEVDNIRCKFDKCSKFVWGVLMHYFKGWFILSSLTAFAFPNELLYSLRICWQDVRYYPFRLDLIIFFQSILSIYAAMTVDSYIFFKCFFFNWKMRLKETNCILNTSI